MSRLWARATRSISGSRRSSIRCFDERTSFTSSWNAASRRAKGEASAGLPAAACSGQSSSASQRPNRKASAWRSVRGTGSGSRARRVGTGLGRSIHQLPPDHPAVLVMRDHVDAAVVIGVLVLAHDLLVLVVVDDHVGAAAAESVLLLPHQLSVLVEADAVPEAVAGGVLLVARGLPVAIEGPAVDGAVVIAVGASAHGHAVLIVDPAVGSAVVVLVEHAPDDLAVLAVDPEVDAPVLVSVDDAVRDRLGGAGRARRV